MHLAACCSGTGISPACAIDAVAAKAHTKQARSLNRALIIIVLMVFVMPLARMAAVMLAGVIVFMAVVVVRLRAMPLFLFVGCLMSIAVRVFSVLMPVFVVMAVIMPVAVAVIFVMRMHRLMMHRLLMSRLGMMRFDTRMPVFIVLATRRQRWLHRHDVLHRHRDFHRVAPQRPHTHRRNNAQHHAK